MKKLLCILAATTMVIGVQAEGDDPGSFGVGLKGIMSSDGGIMPVAVFRFAPAPIGGEIQIGQQTVDIDGVGKTTQLSLNGQLLWSFIQRANSRAYAGGALGVAMLESENDAGTTTVDANVISVGGLVGAEWWMTELPELALNFDVGYYVSSGEDDPGGAIAKADVTLSGILVSLGVTYYF
jgi:hypothetical protein